MVSQFIADAQGLGGRHSGLLLRPASSFELGDGAPVAVNEHVLDTHRSRIAPRTAGVGESPREPSLPSALTQDKIGG